MAQENGTVADEPPILPVGQEQLFSFFEPSLAAGEYTVKVQQDITSESTSESLHLPEGDPTASRADSTAVTQEFQVVAPRYSLPDTAIHSSFPPQGYGALANTLPHVVLSDPHLPWARKVSAEPNPNDPEYTRNRVPWLALLVFDQDELKLSPNQLSTLFVNTSLRSNAKQTQTNTIRLPVEEIAKISSTISPVSALTVEPSEDKEADVILVPSPLFSELVTKYDQNGEPVAQIGPDVSRYKYLAHVRDVNTTGMADAGVEDNGVFGIVISHRTGPLSNTQPQPVVAHLVSIEGVESSFMNQKWPIDSTQIPYVAMTSIYSWSFVTLPEKSFNIESTFESLGAAPNGLNLLRAPDSVLNTIDTSAIMGARLKARLEDGYTLTKYRTVTGEQTAAMYRGPLTPTIVPYPLLPAQAAELGTAWLSNTGIDLQILDPEIGIMDITYSAAWQLGKALAVADQNFTSALGRLRTTIHALTMDRAKAEILRRYGAYETRDEAIQSLRKTLPRLNKLHKCTHGLHAPGGSMADRWRRPQAEALDLSYYSPLIQEIFDQHATAVGRNLMLSPDGDGSQLYDEQNTPNSVDWMVILKWVLDKFSLYAIPAHYLIIDPSYLPQESLRFFHIDRNWMDALVDGALSLGNHLEGIDKVRLAIHTMIQSYLSPKPKSLAPVPQVPTYGFLMRSEAVTKYPDLRVGIELVNVQETAPILRHENLDVSKGIMLCLLDQLPGDPGLKSITFTEPPHQQSFVAGAELDSDHIKTQYKQIFTAKNEAPSPDSWATHEWTSSPVTPSDAKLDEDNDDPHSKYVFKWGAKKDPEVRTLLPISWAFDVNSILNKYGAEGGKYVDNIPNAAMAGIQLNNPLYRLKLESSPTSAEDTAHSGDKRASSSKDVAASFPPVLQSASSTTFPSRARTDSRASHAKASDTVAPEDSSSQLVYRPARPRAPQVRHGFTLGASHGYPALPPPHYRAVPQVPMEIPKPPRGPGTPSGGPIAPPTYDYKVRPIDNDPKNDGIRSGTGVPQDLVFSIIQEPYPDYSDKSYDMEELNILIQLGNDANCLLEGYTGPGPFMANNVRFVVLAQLVPPKDPGDHSYLELRVIPRSVERRAKIAMCTDMTFVLPVCLVRQHQPGDLVTITTAERYPGRDANWIIQYDAIKFAKTESL
jgi:hypothetical protein